MNFLKKAVICFAVFVITAKAAFAQITVDLDVLTEDFIPKDTITLAPPDRAKDVSAPVLKAPAAENKKQPATKKAKPVTKPAVKKPTTKKPASPKKPAKPSVKKTKAVKKYQVKEAARKDEHDRLKPRANPVPKVKILASDNSIKPAEDNIIESTPPETIEPKISKHFLEQERQKTQNAALQTADAAAKSTAADEPEETQQKTKPVKDSFLTLTRDNAPARIRPKTLLSSAEQKSDQKQKTQRPAPVKFSVFYVSGKLTPAERSEALAKEIPQESATRKALDQKKKLLHIFVFESKSSALTDEMRTALDNMAEMMKKNRNKRLILYSYSAPDPDAPGKERQYALRRALMIRSYLTQKGIHSLRIEIRSFGQKGAGEKMPDRTDILTEDR